jgi:preprotein translocase subunit YajC
MEISLIKQLKVGDELFHIGTFKTFTITKIDDRHIVFQLENKESSIEITFANLTIDWLLNKKV